jgi:oxygen-dependent protoporphyrinogen oxidase
MKRVIVVGSGLAGLSAGYRLHEHGWQVTVLESLDRVGGRVLSEADDGFLFDVGPTIVTDKYAEYLKLVSDVGLSGKIVDCPTQMAVVKGDDLHLLDTSRPMRSFGSTKLLPTRAKFRLMANGLRLIRPMSGMRPHDVSNRLRYDEESIETFINRVFGSELNDLLLEGLTRTMTTSSPDQASVIEFFAGASLASGKMQTLVGGLQLLPVTLAAALQVRLNSPVSAVSHSPHGVEVEFTDATGQLIREQADVCVIATPFRTAAAIYPPVQESGAELLDATHDAGCYSLQLAYDRHTEKEPFLVMVPTAASPEIGTLFLEHVKAPDRAPAGTSLITAFFPLGSSIDTSEWSDDRLIATARELVERLFPELSGRFRTAHLTRWPYAAHKGNVGYYRALQRFLDSHPPDDAVRLAGDYMATSGQETAVVTGLNAAKKILAQTV